LKKTPSLELISITSGAGLHAQHAAKKFGFKYTAANESEILKDPEVNTIAILTRHNLHAAQVINALQAGKHVFCEKPLAITPEELAQIKQQLLTQENVPLLMVGFNRRFAPMARKLYEFINPRQAPLVVTYRVNAGNIPLSHWTQDPVQGGGRIIGEGCHFIDFITYLVGSAPSAVTAQSLPDDNRFREDNAIMSFSFPDGSMGTVIYLANGDKAFPKERVEVFVGGKVAVLDDFRRLEMVAHGKRKVLNAWLRQDKGHQAEWEAFSQAVITGGPVPIPYEQIFGVTEASFAAVESIRSRQTIPVSYFHEQS
jgi:predicted dehydrogenase